MALKDFATYIIQTLSDYFQVGKNGPQFKKISSSEMEITTADKSTQAKLKIANPTGPQHAVTKDFQDKNLAPVKVLGQKDCSSALPNNTETEGFWVVTTEGNGATLGDLLYDNGTETGTMTIIPKARRTIFVSTALTGGTINFNAKTSYIFDTIEEEWIAIGDISNTSGGLLVIDFPINNTASQESTNNVPGGNTCYECGLLVSQAYTAGTTIEIGDASDADKFCEADMPEVTKVGYYPIFQRTIFQSTDGKVKVAISGSPTQGAGAVIYKYATPNG